MPAFAGIFVLYTVCPPTQTKVFCQTFVHKSLRFPKAAPLAGFGTASQYINIINKNVQGLYPFLMLSHEARILALCVAHLL